MAPVVPYVKQVWADNDASKPVSAARLGVIEEGILDVSQAPAVRVFHNAAQSIANATATVLAFNSERFDQAGGVASTQHDTVTNNSRLTCLYAGVYQITGSIEWAADPGNASLEIDLNVGLTPIGVTWTLAGSRGMNVTTLYSLAVNDYVQLRASQTSGGALNVSAVGNVSPEFMMIRVG